MFSIGQENVSMNWLTDFISSLVGCYNYTVNNRSQQVESRNLYYITLFNWNIVVEKKESLDFVHFVHFIT